MPRPKAAATPAAAPPATPKALRPPRPTKAEAQAERYPNLDKNPALRRALAIHRAMLGGKTRQAAEKLAEERYGPRSPRTAARAPRKVTRRGKRPEPEKRQRVPPAKPRRKG